MDAAQKLPENVFLITYGGLQVDGSSILIPQRNLMTCGSLLVIDWRRSKASGMVSTVSGSTNGIESAFDGHRAEQRMSKLSTITEATEGNPNA